jgi:ligand-binding SRPBCC domain-containing protein
MADVRTYTLSTEQWLPRPLEEVFAFFSDAQNLDVLTPPWLHFRILTPAPIPMAQGTLIDYRISWRWLPLRWRTEITAWEPPRRFVDRQVRGPYRLWVHEHTFEERDGGTLMRDRVEYGVPGWPLESLVNAWVVRPDIERIFAYRRAKMAELFPTRPLVTSG